MSRGWEGVRIWEGGSFEWAADGRVGLGICTGAWYGQKGGMAERWIFVSYNRDADPKRDLEAFSKQLEQQLQGRVDPDFRVFFDRKGLNAGDDWKKVILERLESAICYLLILTPPYFGRPWCQKEMEVAVRRAESGDARVVPIFLAPTMGRVRPEHQELLDRVLRYQAFQPRDVHRRAEPPVDLEDADRLQLEWVLNQTERVSEAYLFELRERIADNVRELDAVTSTQAAEPEAEEPKRVQSKTTFVGCSLEQLLGRRPDLWTVLARTFQLDEGVTDLEVLLDAIRGLPKTQLWNEGRVTYFYDRALEHGPDTGAPEGGRLGIEEARALYLAVLAAHPESPIRVEQLEDRWRALEYCRVAVALEVARSRGASPHVVPEGSGFRPASEIRLTAPAGLVGNPSAAKPDLEEVRKLIWARMQREGPLPEDFAFDLESYIEGQLELAALGESVDFIPYLVTQVQDSAKLLVAELREGMEDAAKHLIWVEYERTIPSKLAKAVGQLVRGPRGSKS